MSDPQFVDEHDAYLDELILGVRHFARDCLDRVEDEHLPAKRARLAKSGMELALGYAKLLQFRDRRRNSLGKDS